MSQCVIYSKTLYLQSNYSKTGQIALSAGEGVDASQYIYTVYKYIFLSSPWSESERSEQRVEPTLSMRILSPSPGLPWATAPLPPLSSSSWRWRCLCSRSRESSWYWLFLSASSSFCAGEREAMSHTTSGGGGTARREQCVGGRGGRRILFEKGRRQGEVRQVGAGWLRARRARDTIPASSDTP